MNYAKGIRIARAIAGLQQQELAQKAGINPSHISLIEMGKRQPSVGALQKLSAALGIPQHLLVLLSADREEVDLSDPEELNQAAESLARLLFSNGRGRKSRTPRKSAPR